MTSILQPPRPPKRVAKQTTRQPVLKQFLHKVGLLRHDPLDHLLTFHPPAFHPLSFIQKELLKHAHDPKKKKVVFGITTEELEAPLEKKATTLMLSSGIDPGKIAVPKKITPTDTKEFLKETLFVPKNKKKSSDFLRETKDVQMRTSMAPIQQFAYSSPEYADTKTSDWEIHEHHEEESGKFSTFDSDEVLDAGGDFAKGNFA